MLNRNHDVKFGLFIPTFMLVTRGPKAFFIQDIRSSACSCVRRSEAAGGKKPGESEPQTTSLVGLLLEI